MKMNIGKWGNSLAVRLPRELVDKFNLKEGDAFDMDRLERLLTEEREESVQERRKAALEEIRKGAFSLPPDWKMDRDEMNWRPAMDKW